MSTSNWRGHAQKVLGEVFAALPPDATRKDVEKLVSDAYPFGERAMYPYKVWLDEKTKWIDRRFPDEKAARDREKLQRELQERGLTLEPQLTLWSEDTNLMTQDKTVLTASSSNPARFSLDDAEHAYDEWKFNCGPGALCGVLNMTPSEIRPYLLDFEERGHTNPTLLTSILRALEIRYQSLYRGDVPDVSFVYPPLGLVRIQFEGPWTKPNVPMSARYQHTHWAGLRQGQEGYEAFDINAMERGGWMPFFEWRDALIPALICECEPKSTGRWWPTHILEISQRPS